MIKSFDIEKVRVFKEDSGWFLASSTNDETVVGIAFMEPMGKITCEGDWVEHATYGRQFKATKIIYDNPAQVVTQLLASGFLVGVKKHKALAVADALGERVFEILDACLQAPSTMIVWKGKMMLPGDIVVSVKGIKQVVFRQLLESWEERREMVNVAVMGLRAGLTAKQFRSALDAFGEVYLTELILTNPYKLTTIEEITFHDADIIAQLEWENKKAIALDSPLRVGAGIREVIDRQKERGHMCYPYDLVLREASQLLEMHENDIWDIVYDKLDDLDLVKIQTPTTSMLATRRSYDLEWHLAEQLRAIERATFKPKIEKLDQFLRGEFDPNDFSEDLKLTEEQVSAIRMATQSNIGILTGGPGTGKTTITRTLLNILDHFDISYTLASFIAKVAIRMREATGREAHTLHSYFKVFLPEDEREPLGTDYLIIDEASTINVELLSDVMHQVRPGQRVLFIGDSNQLPPIGPGEPFTQLQKVLSYVKLDKIFRQENTSGIVIAAHMILNGEVPPPSIGSDFFSLTVDERDIPDYVLRSLHKIHEKRGIPLNEIQVFTPVHAGAAGRVYLNKVIQDHLNPQGQVVIPGKKNKNDKLVSPDIRIGDRVLHTKNLVHVKNGEIGIVIQADVQQQEDGTLSLFDNGTNWTNEKIVLWVQYPFHDGPTPYKLSEVAYLQLGYVITNHKAIGSEYEAVISVYPYTRESFMFRQLVYTGETRPKKMCVLMAPPGALAKYIANSVRERRYSLLADLMMEV